MALFLGGDPNLKPEYSTESRKYGNSDQASPSKQSPGLGSPTFEPSNNQPRISNNYAFGSQSLPQPIGFSIPPNQKHPGDTGNVSNNNIPSSTAPPMRGVRTVVPILGACATAGVVASNLVPTEKESLQKGGNVSTLTQACIKITDALSNNLKNKNYSHAIFHTNKSSNFSSPQQAFKSDWNWSNPSFVRLPLSSKNRTREGTLKWDIIQQELVKLESLCGNKNGGRAEIAYRLGDAVKAYNNGIDRESNFEILRDPELSQGIANLLPVIVRYALKLLVLLGEPIPKLKRGESKTIYVTRELTCSLLAHGFLCTVPHEGRADDMPYFHFARLFNKEGNDPSRAQGKKEKLKCILEYFSQMDKASAEEGNKIISFERRCITKRVDWAKSDAKLCPVGVNSQSGIESSNGMLQVDFANKGVGGGILNDGTVMEEIRFAICPELILARLFTEALGDDEVLVITGTKQFTSYTGYQSSFQFRKCDKQPSDVPTDGLGRECTQVVAMDALQFSRHTADTQYQRKHIDRELHKCYVGFSHRKQHIAPVATGNWGCGVFHGDRQLKILLQWMAASEVERPSIMFHIDKEQGESVKEILDFLQKRKVTVGKLYKTLLKYDSEGRGRIPLFLFLFQNLK